MKILQVCPRYPPHTGGVETHVKEISERLVERGHGVTVHTADTSGDVDRRETRNGVKVRRHRGLAPGGAFHVAPGITMDVRCADADVVHAHNYHSLPVFFAALGVAGKRFVMTPHYHGGSASPIRDRLLSLYQPFGGWALEQADAVVAVSEWECKRLRTDFGVDPTVIPNGLDVERFRKAEPEIHDRPYLLTVGRLKEYKGVQRAIRALPELPQYNLVVAGSGPYRGELERIAKEMGVGDRVNFQGYVSDDRLPSLYAGAKACLSLSEFEAYGMTVGEALAAGTPVIVRETGGLSEWTDVEGVIGVSDTSLVAETVERVVGAKPETAVLDWEDVVQRLIETYQSV